MLNGRYRPNKMSKRNRGAKLRSQIEEQSREGKKKYIYFAKKLSSSQIGGVVRRFGWESEDSRFKSYKCQLTLLFYREKKSGSKVGNRSREAK